MGTVERQLHVVPPSVEIRIDRHFAAHGFGQVGRGCDLRWIGGINCEIRLAVRVRLAAQRCRYDVHDRD